MGFFRENLAIGITSNEYEYFMTKANVVGIGVGNKIIRGIDTAEKCISVFVKEKLPVDKIKSVDLIPKIYMGVKTDVVKTGEFSPLSGKSKVRPIQGGYSVSPSNVKYAGTIGGIIYDNVTNKPYILSNNHVLADINKSRIGTPIVQPAIIDGGDASTDIIATLHKVVLLNFDESFPNPHYNYADCAIAEVNTDIQIANIMLGSFLRIKGINHNIQVGERIQKYGRTTGYTSGKVTAINTVTGVTVKGNGLATFYNQIMANKMLEGGDSGSLILDFDDKIVGLGYAGAEGGALITPIKLVLDYFNAHFNFI